MRIKSERTRETGAIQLLKGANAEEGARYLGQPILGQFRPDMELTYCT